MASRSKPSADAGPCPRSPERLIEATNAAMEHLTIWHGQEVYEAATLDDFHAAVTPALVAGLWSALQKAESIGSAERQRAEGSAPWDTQNPETEIEDLLQQQVIP